MGCGPLHEPRSQVRSCFAQRRTNALDHDRQSTDDEFIWKSKNAKSLASKPRIPLGIPALRIRRLVRAVRRRELPREANEVREIAARSAFACESHTRRSDDCALRATAWSPLASCSDAAVERTCGRTDGRAAARPFCLGSMSVTFSTLPEAIRSAGSSMIRCPTRKRIAWLALRIGHRRSPAFHTPSGASRHLPQQSWRRGSHWPAISSRTPSTSRPRSSRKRVIAQIRSWKTVSPERRLRSFPLTWMERVYEGRAFQSLWRWERPRGRRCPGSRAGRGRSADPRSRPPRSILAKRKSAKACCMRAGPRLSPPARARTSPGW